MAAPPLNLYVDIQARRLVKSSVSTAQASSPVFRQGESPTLRVYFLDPDGGTVSAPYPTAYKPAGLGVKVGLCAGTPTGGTDTLVAFQDTFTQTGNYFTASLNCNTSEMAVALASAAQLAGRIEIEVTPSGESPIKLVQDLCLLQAAVIDDAGVIPTPRSEYPTRGEANATYTKRIGLAGESIILVSPDGTKAVELVCTDAGKLDVIEIPTWP